MDGSSSTAEPLLLAAAAHEDGGSDDAVGGRSAWQPRRDPAVLALVLLVGVGVALRVVQWLSARSLWLDEISIALNLQTRSYGQLVGELGGHQVAPVGWLWFERWMFLNIGYGERTLRLLPLMFGCAALVVIALLARRVLSPAAAAIAVGLAAFSPPLIRYSNELKQYSSDTLWVPLLALLTLRCLAAPTSWTTHLAWAAAGALGLAFSHALLLALAGFGLVLLGAAVVHRRWKALAPVLAAGSIVATAVAVEYVVQLARVSEDTTLEAFWIKVGGFPVDPVGFSSTLRWLGGRAAELPAEPAGLEPALVGLLLIVTGGVVLARRRPWMLLVLAAPLAVAVLAALAHAYPLADRVSLYLTPLAFVVAAAALDTPGRRGGRLVRLASVIALLVVAVPTVAHAVREVRTPLEISETRTAAEYIGSRLQPGDGVFVYYTAGSSARYYFPKVGLPYDGTLYLTSSSSDLCRERAASPRLSATGRTWVLFGVRLSSAALDERDVVLAHLGRHGRLIDAHVDTEAGAYLFDTTRPQPAQPGNRLTERPEQDCLISQPPPPFPPMP